MSDQPDDLDPRWLRALRAHADITPPDDEAWAAVQRRARDRRPMRTGKGLAVAAALILIAGAVTAVAIAADRQHQHAQVRTQDRPTSPIDPSPSAKASPSTSVPPKQRRLLTCSGHLPPKGQDPTMQVDWVDFVVLDGRTYLGAGDARGGPSSTVTAAALGRPVGRICINVKQRRVDVHRQRSDQEAAFLPEGTVLYDVTGYPTRFRLAAKVGSQVRLYEVDTDPSARVAKDLLGFEAEQVRAIGINSSIDGKTRLATITDRVEIDRLVTQLLAFPVDQRSQEKPDTKVLFLAFELTDDTTVTRPLAANTRVLQRGIRATSSWVEQILAHRPGKTPTTVGRVGS